jgi:hypothetical protein
VIPEADPIEVLKLTVRPLKIEATKPSESDRDLKSEVCSTKPEAEPNETLKFTALPLWKELPSPIEPAKDLNNET